MLIFGKNHVITYTRGISHNNASSNTQVLFDTQELKHTHLIRRETAAHKLCYWVIKS